MDLHRVKWSREYLSHRLKLEGRMCHPEVNGMIVPSAGCVQGIVFQANREERVYKIKPIYDNCTKAVYKHTTSNNWGRLHELKIIHINENSNQSNFVEIIETLQGSFPQAI